MIVARVDPPGGILLAAPVRGLAAESGRLLGELAAYDPRAIGLGVSAEELRSLTNYFVTSESEPVVPLTENEASEVRGLVRFGEVRVPNPSVVETLRFAADRHLAVEALDPSDERAASLFTEHIGYVELVRRTVAERRIGRNPPAPSSPDEFALTWDGEVAGGRGSRAFAQARDRHLARAAAQLAREQGRIAVVVDRERFDSVRALLARPASAVLADE
ncbi:MAG TPA: hypothetical protein VMG99_02565 [Thermoplasmata archaeon]|nr:hypothetical protein [Thermoplasmata archaeon]